MKSADRKKKTYDLSRRETLCVETLRSPRDESNGTLSLLSKKELPGILTGLLLHLAHFL
jgi:hypothetical protein